MNCRAVTLLASAVFFCSCEEKKEITVTETRAATTRDMSPKLFATSDERFRDAKPSPVIGDAPADWLALPPSQFRLLNYRFGESGLSKIYSPQIVGSPYFVVSTRRLVARCSSARPCSVAPQPCSLEQ